MSGSDNQVCQRSFRTFWAILPICFEKSSAWRALSFPPISPRKFRGAVWLGLAGLFGLLALASLLGAAVAWITTFDVSLHIAFLMVAAAVALLAAFAYFAGRSEIQAELTPSRTISQLKQDIETTKEQLT